MSKTLSIRGARTHNLANIDVDVPKGTLTAFSGVSGSGKSSLAFDTIYAEGQRRYVESLSAYARQFLEMQDKPDVDHIDGLSPAISIEQKTTSRNPRSTVGTITEIYDYMRVLWARVGIPYSPATGLPITSQTVSEMTDAILAMPEGTRLYLLAPVVRNRKGEYKKEFVQWLRQGLTRAKIDGEFVEFETPPALEKNTPHNIDLVVDRLILRGEDLQQRLSEGLETALDLADGLAVVERVAPSSHAEEPAREPSERPAAPTKSAKKGKKWAGTLQDPNRTLFSARYSCPVSGFAIEDLEPRLFSFNNPRGACASCDGLGSTMKIDPALLVPDPTLSLLEGAIASWTKPLSDYAAGTIAALCKHYDVDPATPWRDLPEETKSAFLYGTKRVKIRFVYNRRWVRVKTFEGIIPNLTRRWHETDSDLVRDYLAAFQSQALCESCTGARLRPEALAVRVGDRTIGSVSAMTVKEAARWISEVEQQLTAPQRTIAAGLIREISARLSFLLSVGLDYLTLSRTSGTLSGGESQRIRLASQIGSGLTGVLYVLDEPSIGLHARDNSRLIAMLQRLRDLDNTVIVVEHDEETLRAADFIVDIGPGAGEHGGRVMSTGSIDDLIASDSLTGKYLDGRLAVPVPAERRAYQPDRVITVRGACANNLKNVDASIPLGVLSCVTGVSGSGKSSLLLESVYPAASRILNRARATVPQCDSIDGLQFLDKVIHIDQSPIGRTPRSNPATYSGAFTPIREWFASLPESKARGYKPGRFSFNVKGGRCEACEGDGVKKIEMHFLSDVYVQCDLCKGKRFNRETLSVTWNGKSISDVLDMTIEAACAMFKDVTPVYNRIRSLEDVGLGYMRLGQSATTLSGGEAQRVKFARELAKRATGKTLYILDEPTTGLHFHDVDQLLKILHRLVDSGNTVIVIEHNLDVLKTADWIIDIGPEGGDQGGTVVVAGTPEDIAACKASHTGQALAPLLRGKKKPSGTTRPKPKPTKPAKKNAKGSTPQSKNTAKSASE